VLHHWVIAAKCQTLQLDISTLEDEITMPSWKVRHQSLSDLSLHTRRMETSTALR